MSLKEMSLAHEVQTRQLESSQNCVDLRKLINRMNHWDKVPINNIVCLNLQSCSLYGDVEMRLNHDRLAVVNTIKDCLSKSSPCAKYKMFIQTEKLGSELSFVTLPPAFISVSGAPGSSTEELGLNKSTTTDKFIGDPIPVKCIAQEPTLQLQHDQISH